MEHQMEYNMIMTSYGRHKARIIKMSRHKDAVFGFAIRGGKEHGTGIFVTEVNRGSEADTCGLKVGDQIIRVNGFNIEEAIHEEVINLLKSKNQLILRVKSIGMVPVKKQATDNVTWKVVAPLDNVQPHCRLISSSVSIQSGEFPELKVSLNLRSQRSFGCNICKGPPDNPGIFIQTTKESGLAHEVGLRPGDQLLEANGKLLSKMEFQEAVSYLKSTEQVDLLVRKGAGAYLFPGGSSGYNSSNSSVNGENNVEDFHNGLPATDEEREIPTDEISVTYNNNKQGIVISQIDKVLVTSEVAHTPKKMPHEDINGTTSNHITVDAAADVRPWSEKDHLEVFKKEQEDEKKNKERMDEKLRTVEYASRLEAQMVDEDIIEHAETLLMTRKTSTQSSAQSHEKDVAETSKLTADPPLRTNTSNDESDTKASVVTISKHGTRWKKTILAEVHNTPNPKMNVTVNGTNHSTSVVDDSEPEEAIHHHQPQTQPNKQNDVYSETNDTGHHQKNRHDQLIEEFKKVHRKMLAMQEKDEPSTDPSIEAKKIEIIQNDDRQPVSILKKPVAVLPPSTTRKTAEEPDAAVTELTINQKKQQIPNVITTPVVVSLPVIEKNELENALRNLRCTQHTSSSKDLTLQKPLEDLPKVEDKPPVVLTAVKNGKPKPITDSSLRIPKPPEYFFPKSKTPVLVKIQAYESQDKRPTPQRFEFLKSHPSIELEILSNGVGKVDASAYTKSVSSIAKPATNVKVVSGVTKIPVNKTPNEKPATSTVVVINPTETAPQLMPRPATNVTSRLTAPENSNGVKQAIEKLKAKSNMTTTEQNMKPKSVNIKPQLEPLPNKTLNGTTDVAKNRFLVKSTADTTTSKINHSKFNGADIKQDQLNSSSSKCVAFHLTSSKNDVKIVAAARSELNSASNNIESRLARRQRTPMAGDHSLSIKIPPEAEVIISSHQ